MAKLSLIASDVIRFSFMFFLFSLRCCYSLTTICHAANWSCTNHYRFAIAYVTKTFFSLHLSVFMNFGTDNLFVSCKFVFISFSTRSIFVRLYFFSFAFFSFGPLVYFHFNHSSSKDALALASTSVHTAAFSLLSMPTVRHLIVWFTLCVKKKKRK